MDYEIALPTHIQALRRQADKPKWVSLHIASLKFPCERDVAEIMHNGLTSLDLYLFGTTIDGVVIEDAVWLSSLLRNQRNSLPLFEVFPETEYAFLSKNVPRSLLSQRPQQLISKLSFTSFSFGPQTIQNLCRALKFCSKSGVVSLAGSRFFGPVGGILLELLTFREFFIGAWCHSHRKDLSRILRYQSRLTEQTERKGLFNVGSNEGKLPKAVIKSMASVVERIPGLKTYIVEIADAYENVDYLNQDLAYMGV